MQEATVLMIKSAMAGRIIGRGGAKIQRIQRNTGAGIKITDGETPDTRFVRIVGTEEAQIAAVVVIHGIVKGKILRSERVAAAAAWFQWNRGGSGAGASRGRRAGGGNDGDGAGGSRGSDIAEGGRGGNGARGGCGRGGYGIRGCRVWGGIRVRGGRGRFVIGARGGRGWGGDGVRGGHGWGGNGVRGCRGRGGIRVRGGRVRFVIGARGGHGWGGIGVRGGCGGDEAGGNRGNDGAEEGRSRGGNGARRGRGWGGYGVRGGRGWFVIGARGGRGWGGNGTRGGCGRGGNGAGGCRDWGGIGARGGCGGDEAGGNRGNDSAEEGRSRGGNGARRGRGWGGNGVRGGRCRFVIGARGGRGWGGNGTRGGRGRGVNGAGGSRDGDGAGESRGGNGGSGSCSQEGNEAGGGRGRGGEIKELQASQQPRMLPNLLIISEEVVARLEREDEELMREQKPVIYDIRKDFYKQHAELMAMTQEEVQAYRLAKYLSLSYAFSCRRRNKILDNHGSVAPLWYPNLRPVRTFAHAFHDNPEVMHVIERQGFTEPTPVQCQAWPVLLSGNDLIVIAKTGAGKTLAYALPAIVHLLGQPTPRPKWIGPSAVVLAPTRELVQQIGAEIKKYVYSGVRVQCLYCCVNERRQSKEVVESRPDVLVATPDRLYDLVERMNVRLNHVSYLVLDEADRMTDMGLGPLIGLTLRQIRSDRQTVIISATWPEGVRELADQFTRQPLMLVVGSIDLSTVDPVRQLVYVLADESDKEQWLDNFVDKQLSPNDKLIIFMREKEDVDKLYLKLLGKNLPCRCIYGFRIQRDQKASFIKMRDGSVPILIVTDMASRGMDIEGASLVINYDYPVNIDEYIHRVGRIGRAGSAITLLTDRDAENALTLIDILEKSEQPVPPLLYSMAKRI